MKGVVKVEFNELSKSVTANTKIEVEFEEAGVEEIKVLKNEILAEARGLFDDALKYSKAKTFEKNL